MNNKIIPSIVASLIFAGPVIAKPELSVNVWAGFATYKDNDPDWNFVYSLDASMIGGTTIRGTEVGYELLFGGEVARPEKSWKIGSETVDLSLYADFGNAGVLRFTTLDRCDSDSWISGGIIESSITSSLGQTPDFDGTFSSSAFRCAGGDGANSHFVYENSFGGIDWRLFGDPDQMYDGDYLGDGVKFEPAAQIELEANFDLGPARVTLATNEFADFRAEVSSDIGKSPFGIYGSFQTGELDDQKAQVILSYSPEQIEYLSSIRIGYEASEYTGGISENNAVIQASFEKEDWTLDVAYDQNKDFALEGHYYLNEQFEVGVGLSRLDVTNEKSYEIGIGFSF